MPREKADLILNPIRLRILTSISSYRLTAKEIAKDLPDIPQTTLYRHIHTLIEGGLVRVVEERPIRGTIERVFALTAPPSLTPEDLRDMSRQKCEQAFTLFLSSLMSDAQQYLNTKPNRAKINPMEDGVQISTVKLFLDEAEFQRMNSAVQALMLQAAQNQPRAGRRRRAFAYVFIPAGNEGDHS
jgi:DNA-binding transcriptional ArsR family regulator